jgi:hypothetical protein
MEYASLKTETFTTAGEKYIPSGASTYQGVRLRAIYWQAVDTTTLLFKDKESGDTLLNVPHFPIDSGVYQSAANESFIIDMPCRGIRFPSGINVAVPSIPGTGYSLTVVYEG